MKKERSFRFYIEQFGAHSSFTNEALAAFLADKDVLAGTPDQIRYKGKLLCVWQVRHDVITRLENATLTFPFQFRAYAQEGDGEIKPYRLYKKKRMSAHRKEMGRKLEEIQARRK